MREDNSFAFTAYYIAYLTRGLNKNIFYQLLILIEGFSWANQFFRIVRADHVKLDIPFITTENNLTQQTIIGFMWLVLV